MTYKDQSNMFLLGCASLLFGGAVYLHSYFEKPKLNISKQDSKLNIDKDIIKALSLGNKRLLSDLIWIQTLIESDIEKYEKNDLKDWMYLRFLTISELDPLFYHNYLFGGQYLSIVKDDLEAAANIYERGLRYYPDDYSLNFNAGFNYYFELRDYKKAKPLFSKIMNHPKAPFFLFSIVNKMNLEMSFDFDQAIQLLNHQINLTIDPVLKNKLEVDLYAVKAERDLNCLNQGKKNCEKLDSKGKPYYKINDKWRSGEEFIPYRLKISSKKK